MDAGQREGDVVASCATAVAAAVKGHAVCDVATALEASLEVTPHATSRRHVVGDGPVGRTQALIP